MMNSEEASWCLSRFTFIIYLPFSIKKKKSHPISLRPFHKGFFVVRHELNNCYRMWAQNTHIGRRVYTVWIVLHYAPWSPPPGALINPSQFWHIETKHVWASGEVGCGTWQQSTAIVSGCRCCFLREAKKIFFKYCKNSPSILRACSVPVHCKRGSGLKMCMNHR